MKNNILYTKPSITELEIQYATNAAKEGWGANCYDYINRFEDAFKNHLGVKYAIATSSCTGALHMGLSALNIGAGDEVILADSNWIASAAPITYLGAKPVFVDIFPDSWCINTEFVKSAITPRTKAIIAVHLYGNLCDMDNLIKIGEEYKIPIIEDAAEAIGSKYHGKSAGSIGKFGTFSFHGTKTITTGEGGMFVTNDKNLYDRVLTLSNHGRIEGQVKQFWPDAIGFKYKMSNIQAAIGCAQMERVEALVRRKREILSFYKTALNDTPGIHFNPEPPGIINGAWMPTVVFDKNLKISREILQAAFFEENIDARVFFWPLSSTPAFVEKKRPFMNKTAQDICNRAINLPSYHDITNEEQLRVVSVIKMLINKFYVD